MLDLLEPHDVVLADRYYASFCDFALLDQRNVRLVTRQHQLRTTDFRRGTRLGRGDHLVTWAKPQQRPDWLDRETYERLPDELLLRKVRIQVEPSGFRVHEYVLFTTLYDHEQYTTDDLADLYRQRWHDELNLRSPKSAMQLDRLRCLTPEMIRTKKSPCIYWPTTPSVASWPKRLAITTCVPPRSASLARCKTLRAFHEQGLLDDTPSTDTVTTLLTAIAMHQVGKRPDRNELRANKRRPKYKFLTKPRHTFPNRVPHKT